MKIGSGIAIRKIADLIREKEKLRTLAKINKPENRSILKKPNLINRRKPTKTNENRSFFKDGTENEAAANLRRRAAARRAALGFGARVAGFGWASPRLIKPSWPGVRVGHGP